MATRSDVLADIALLRQSLRRTGNPHLPLLRVDLWRPLRDIALDIAMIAGALALAVTVPWTIPLPLLVLGNRQRALGNILHDAAHRNLTRDRWLNDLVTRLVVAPMLFASLSRYRELHFRHHLELGAQDADPDLLPVPPRKARSWARALAANAWSRRAVAGSLFGHLRDSGLPLRSRLYLVGWWALLCGAAAVAVGPALMAGALGVWLAARATTFHLITTFREMCDHHGLSPGGVFGFTRDIRATGAWSWIIHPRHNAYHLTHHLLPAVPYYRLPQAQRLFATLPEYQARAHVCRSYFTGASPVVAQWQQAPRP
jgi:fatty acid desaturase